MSNPENNPGGEPKEAAYFNKDSTESEDFYNTALKEKEEKLRTELSFKRDILGEIITEQELAKIFGDEIKDLYVRFRKDLGDKLNVSLKNLFETLKKEFINSSDEDEKTQSSFYLGEKDEVDMSRVADYGDFLKRIKCPERGKGEELKNYLPRLYTALLRRALIYFWNKSEDSAASAPRTKDYRIDPMYGPSTKVDLLKATLIYLEKEETEVKTFDAFFDQFATLFLKSEDIEFVGKEMGRWKNLFSEMDVLHNRAVIRRDGNNPNGPGYDPKGPDGALEGLANLQNNVGMDLQRIFPSREVGEEIPVQEKEFLAACEFCMGVWSAMTLKMQDRVLLYPHMSEHVKSFFKEPVLDPTTHKIIKVEVKDGKDNEGNPIKDGPDYTGVLPIVNGLGGSKQLKMVNEIINKSSSMMESVPEDQREYLAKLAYHVGESYRIGGGMDTFFDVSYGEKGVDAKAQDGETKIASFGAYVESNNRKGIRTEYLDPYKEKLFHLYLPVTVYMQYNHNYGHQLSEVNDGRASLATLLSVKDGVYSIDWSSGVNTPDFFIAKMSEEARLGYWNLSTTTNALKNPDQLLWDPAKDFKGDRTSEMSRDSIAAFFDPDRQRMARIKDKIEKATGGNRYISANEAVSIAFKTSETSRLTDADAGRIKDSILKHVVDYYMGTWNTNHPGDFIRNARFLFSRDDRPENNYFITERVQKLFDHAPELGKEESEGLSEDEIKSKRKKAVVNFDDYSRIDTKTIEKASKTLSSRLAAYLLFDVNMCVTAWLNKPRPEKNSRISELLASGSNWEELTKSLNKQSIASMRISSPSNRVMHTKAIEAAINRMLVIRNHPDFKEHWEKYYNSGYRLMEGSDTGTIFSRDDILKFFQREARWAEEKHWEQILDNSSGDERVINILREDDGKASLQRFIDTQLAIESIFGGEK